MEMVIYVACGMLALILSVTWLRKRIKENNDKFIKRLENSQQNIEDPFKGFMCLRLTDGSTIIRGRGFNVKGNAERMTK